MNDEQILKLYMIRDQQAIAETNDKYRNYLYHIAYGILKSHEDTEECINDTYTKLWDSIPPKKPLSLSVYAAKITKNIAINKRKYNMAEKRSDTNTVIFDELESVKEQALKIAENIRTQLGYEDWILSEQKHYEDGGICRNQFSYIPAYNGNGIDADATIFSSSHSSDNATAEIYPESLEIYIENGDLHFVALTSPMDILSTDNTDTISFEDAYATFKDEMTSSFTKNQYYNFTNWFDKNDEAYNDNIQLTINDITETMIRTGNTENGYSIIPAWVFSGNVYRENEFLTADIFAVVSALDGTIISENQSDNPVE